MGDAIFTQNVFLSHSVKDKAVVRAVAERLRANGLKLWFDEWETAQANNATQKRPSEFQPLAFSLQPFLDLSANAFGSDWAQLEAGTFGRGNLPSRGLLNQLRRFIPQRLDAAPPRCSGGRFDSRNFASEIGVNRFSPQP